ncbi:hypothetical protein IU434_26470 [Nocardia farcinica]|uniref:hypothetical protein n=1 Tax=Nocardia farcinica TaxID=37329 RepID=UPI0018960781|nr:hypothetical protein [Nocardia farcinica]MBF6445553.1 hypothetical protein [Nocardia farcinica]
MSLILDPRILTFVEESSTQEELAALWTKVVQWASDRRVGVGEHTLEHMWGHLTSRGYPENDLRMHPQSMRTVYREALNKLLARVVSAGSHPADRNTNPEYLGTYYEKRALAFDVTSTIDKNILGIATTPSSWEFETELVEFSPQPPNALALCFAPGIKLTEERANELRAKFVGKRIHIVGGQPSERVLKSIMDTTGLPARSVDWIPSERSQKPRDLDKKWDCLEPGRDITICVTGRIGHAQSNAARAAAKKAGVPYLPIEQANDIPGGLERFALRMDLQQG